MGITRSGAVCAVVTEGKLVLMQKNEQENAVEHDAAPAHGSDEARAEHTPAVRLLANPRRVRRD
jgi:hypothetical protein